MRRLKILLAIIFGTACLAIILWWGVNTGLRQFFLPRQMRFPLNPGAYSLAGGSTFDTPLRFNVFQPILLGYKSANNRHYLIVTYSREGRWVKTAVLVAGAFLGDGEAVWETISFTDKNGGNNSVDFRSLQKRLTRFRQIKIKYLSQWPDDRPEKSCRILAVLCQLAEAAERKNSFLAADFSKRERAEELLVAAEISLELANE